MIVLLCLVINRHSCCTVLPQLSAAMIDISLYMYLQFPQLFFFYFNDSSRYSSFAKNFSIRDCAIFAAVQTQTRRAKEVRTSRINSTCRVSLVRTLVKIAPN